MRKWELDAKVSVCDVMDCGVSPPTSFVYFHTFQQSNMNPIIYIIIKTCFDIYLTLSYNISYGMM